MSTNSLLQMKKQIKLEKAQELLEALEISVQKKQMNY